MKTIGVILAGGNSTRFGEDKSLYEIDGRPMYSHIADTLKTSGICDHIVISTNDRLSTRFPDLETVTDDGTYRDRGPLGGIYAVAKAFPGRRLLIVSCDTPYIPARWFRILHQEAAAHTESIVLTMEEDILHPLIGVYQGEELEAALENQLVGGRLSMRAFFENRQIIRLDAISNGIKHEQLVNINRRTDILSGGVSW